MKSIFLLSITLFLSLVVNAQIITTICGNGVAGYDGDGKSGNSVRLNNPDGICLDKFYNLYISDALNCRIRKLNLSSGIITTIAGNGLVGFSGDGGPATNAGLYIPEDVAIDTFGNVFIVDAGSNRIRKVTSSTGIITTIAGSGPVGVGVGGAIGDGGPATNAELNNPFGLCLDKAGNIFIADQNNNKIRRVDAVTNVITTIAGNGVSGNSGDGGQATNAHLNKPSQIYTDSSGNIFFTQSYDNVVRKVNISTGIITTIAGNGTQGFSGDGGQATDAQLNAPIGVYIDEQQNVIVAEWGSGVIRKINQATGIITTVAGTGIQGFSGDGGPATSAQLIPEDMCFDKYGSMYIADYDNNRIRMIRDTTLHVVVNEIVKHEVKIYPNPANDELTIEGAEGSEVNVYNTIGQQVIHMNKLKNTQLLNIATLIPGMYVLSVVNPTNGVKVITRVVKE